MNISIPQEWLAYLPKFLQNADCAWLQAHQDSVTAQELAERTDSVIEDWSNTTRVNNALRLQRAVEEVGFEAEQDWMRTTTGYVQAVVSSMRGMVAAPQNHFEGDDGERLPDEECIRRAARYIVESMRDAHEEWLYLTRGRNFVAAAVAC